MAEQKVIAVVGATGAQGGGLARAILADPDGGFSVRAITRNPDSDKARALKDAGAEVVQADLDDEASLKAAFDGAYGAFCVTNFWESMDPEKEKQQAANLAAAAKAAGVQHVIWSTLEDTRERVPLSDDRMPTLMDQYKVPHFDAKGEANRYFTDAGVPTTLLYTSFYWDNLIYFGLGPKRGPDGKLYLSMPMGQRPMAGIAAEDIGKSAYGIFKAGDAYIGKSVGIAGGHLTGAEMAESLSRVTPEPVGYAPVTPEQFRSFGFPGADDMGNMFQYYQDFADEFSGARNLDESRRLNPELQSFDEWTAENGRRIPLE